ncbi:MAG: phosphotransferase [Acidobacteriia bacterium]|nr:phosphotransferase [Terriglobia bacterium]
MSDTWLEVIPEHLQDTARAAVSSAFGSTFVTSLQPVAGGASGALTYRVDVDGRPYLLRMETRRSPLRNPHQYVCMRIAADAGIAPPLRYADDAGGVAIIDFVMQRPLQEYPGGPAGLATAIGELAASLQAAAPFPVLGDYRVFLDRMLSYVRRSFAPGLLDRHVEGFERIRQAYRWDASVHISSHNDPNPGNILFDGERLWMIDWETAYRNDSLTDIAILMENFARTPELEDVLLRSWLGGPPDRALRARLVLMRQMTRLYYAGIVLASSIGTPGAAPVMDLSAPNPAEFRALIASGQLKMGTPETMLVLGKMFLAGFLGGLDEPAFQEALVIAPQA